MRTITIAATLLCAAVAALNAQTVVGYATIIPSKIPAELKAADTSHALDKVLPGIVERVDLFAVLTVKEGRPDVAPLLVVRASNPGAFTQFARTSPFWSLFEFTPQGGSLVGRLNAKAGATSQPVGEATAQICLQKSAAACELPVRAVVYPATTLAALKADKTMATVIESAYKNSAVLSELESVKSLELQLQGTSKIFRVGVVLRATQGSALGAYFSQKLPWFFPAEQGMIEVDKAPGYGYALGDPAATKAYWKHLKELFDKSQMPDHTRSVMALIDSTIQKSASNGYAAIVMDSQINGKSFTSGHYTKESLNAQLQDSVKMVSLLNVQKTATVSGAARPAPHSEATLSGPTQVAGLPVWKVSEQTKGSAEMEVVSQYQYYALKDGNILTCVCLGKDDPTVMQRFIDSMKVAPKRPLSKEFSPFPSAACQWKINFVNCIEAAKTRPDVSPRDAAQLSATEALFEPEDCVSINCSFSNGAAAVAIDLPMPLVKKAAAFAAAGAAMSSAESTGANAPAPQRARPYVNKHTTLPGATQQPIGK